MPHARLVNIDFEIGIFFDERTGRAGVVQMNMREQNGVQVGDAEAARIEMMAKCGEGGSRARIEERAMASGFKKSGGNGARTAEPVGIKNRRGKVIVRSVTRVSAGESDAGRRIGDPSSPFFVSADSKGV